jgi:hypothetical protein
MPLPLLGIAASAVGRLAGSSLLRGGIGGIARGLAIGAVKDSVEDSEKPRMPLLPPSQDSSEESTNTNINPNLIRQKILNASIEPIRKALILSMQEMGRDIFKRSQNNVPVRTGRLKSSGYYKDLENGAEVGYNTPYAAYVEFGARRGGERSGFAKMSNQRSLSTNQFSRRNVNDTKKSGHFMKRSIDEAMGDGKTLGRYIKKYGQKELDRVNWKEVIGH